MRLQRKKNNVFTRIEDWNKKRNNLDFNTRREVKMIAEELFEAMLYTREEAKTESEQFVIGTYDQYNGAPYNMDCDDPVTLLHYGSGIADAYGDILFIAIGSLIKLGYDPEEVLLKICNHNDAKGSKKDKDGKIVKDTSTFVEPKH